MRCHHINRKEQLASLLEGFHFQSVFTQIIEVKSLNNPPPMSHFSFQKLIEVSGS